MTDRLDNLLQRLPDESPAVDLVTRIAATVIARRAIMAQRAQRWRRIIGIGVAVTSVLGLIFLIADLPVLFNSIVEIFVLLQINLFDLSNGLNALLVSSSDSFGAALVLGLAFLLLATFGGLVQLLNTPTRSVSG